MFKVYPVCCWNMVSPKNVSLNDCTLSDRAKPSNGVSELGWSPRFVEDRRLANLLMRLI